VSTTTDLLRGGGASDGVRTGRGAWLRACACAPNGVRGRVRKIGGTSYVDQLGLGTSPLKAYLYRYAMG